MNSASTDGLLQGDVWWASLGPTRGREQDGFRPVVVVASNAYLAAVDTLTIVVPVTTTDRGWSNHVRLVGDLHLGAPSWAMTEQPNTVARARLARPAGSVDAECFRSIQRYLRDFLGL